MRILITLALVGLSACSITLQQAPSDTWAPKDGPPRCSDSAAFFVVDALAVAGAAAVGLEGYDSDSPAVFSAGVAGTLVFLTSAVLGEWWADRCEVQRREHLIHFTEGGRAARPYTLSGAGIP